MRPTTTRTDRQTLRIKSPDIVKAIFIAAVSLWEVNLPNDTAAAEAFKLATANDETLPFRQSAQVQSRLSFGIAVLGQLLSRDARNDLAPSLAHRFTWDTVNRVAILSLPVDLRFHNGRPVVAADVEFGIARWLFTSAPTFMRGFLQSIDGASQIKPGSVYSPGLIAGIRVIDSHTIQFKSVDQNPSFLYTFISPLLAPVPIEEFQDDYLTWRTHPIGAGPYRVAEIRVKASEVEVAATGGDVLGPTRVTFTTDPRCDDADIYLYAKTTSKPHYMKVRLNSFDYVHTIFFNFNSRVGRLKDLRRAVAHAVDRHQLTGNGGDFVACSEILPSRFWWSPMLTDANPLRSKTLLKGLSKELGNTRFVIQAPDEEYIAELQDQLLGVGLDVAFIPWRDKLLRRNDMDTPFIVCPLAISDVADPVQCFAPFRDGNAMSHYHPAGDREFEQLFLGAKKAGSFEVRIGLARQLSKHFNGNVFGVPLLASRTRFIVNSETVRTVGPQVSGVAFDVGLVR